MKRKWHFVWMALCLVMLVSGCATQSLNPLARNEATAVPGLAMNLHAASAGEGNTDQVQATLYFRYLNEPMLAAEDRMLTVQRDESVELAIVRALVEGPSAGGSELRRLLPANASVQSVTSRNDILFVTFDDALLRDEVPTNWREFADWQTEAPIRRMLALQSIAASITELFPYTGIQILVYRTDEVQTNLRLENSYFLTDQEGLSDPIARNEDYILTPYNTVKHLLDAWQQHDFERLYHYVSEQEKPSYAIMKELLESANALTAFSVSAGSVSTDGARATLTLSLRTLAGGISTETNAFPLHLTQDHGIWKIDYAQLIALMNR